MSNPPRLTYGSHLRLSMPGPRIIQKRIARTVNKHLPTTDLTILATGLSGIVPASIFAYRTNRKLCIIRKPSERSHGSLIEGWPSDEPTWLLIDDFSDSGATLNRVREAIGEWPHWALFYSAAPFSDHAMPIHNYTKVSPFLWRRNPCSA